LSDPRDITPVPEPALAYVDKRLSLLSRNLGAVLRLSTLVVAYEEDRASIGLDANELHAVRRAGKIALDHVAADQTFALD
jgi:hypothetical protein